MTSIDYIPSLEDLAMKNPVSDSHERAPNLLSIVACAIAAGYVGALALLFIRHQWIVDRQGRPIRPPGWAAEQLARAFG